MDYGTGSTGNRMITAYFEDRSSAVRAVERLTALGIPQSQVRLTEGSSSSTTTTAATEEHQSKGFLDSLADLFLPDEDRYTYAEGLRRGGYVVSAQVDDATYDRALDILDDDGTVDINEREQTWRSEGWTGYEGGRDYTSGSDRAYADRSSTTGYGSDSSLTGSSTTGYGSDSSLTGSGTSAYAADDSLTGSSSTYDRSTATTDTGLFGTDTDRTYREGESIPVAEERLRIGKRDVEHGRVRVRSYVIEEPVREDVTLRQERVDIERRPVDRPATAADNLFHERTIELEERGEEAVVSKEARVTEEVSLRKEATERTEQVSDTIRRTEVEVEDERGLRRDSDLRRG